MDEADLPAQTEPRIVRFYLDKGLKARAEAGDHTFLNRFCGVLDQHGFRVKFHVLNPAEEVKSALRPGYAVFLMRQPTTPNGLTIRKNYIYPFWKIEQTAERWRWPVAEAAFDPAAVPRAEAERFAGFWRERLFPDLTGTPRREGYVYVPLQGRLLERRHFQTCTPIAMLEEVLEAEPTREVRATLHPRETYTANEHAALWDLAKRYPRFRLTDAASETLLEGCDYVATMNSGAAVLGYFLGKPAALFARIDFHHIAANVHEMGAAEALARAPEMTPDFDAYLWWFLQEQSINAGRKGAEDKIEAAIRKAGWID